VLDLTLEDICPSEAGETVAEPDEGDTPRSIVER